MWLPPKYSDALTPGKFIGASGLTLEGKIDLPRLYSQPGMLATMASELAELIPPGVTTLAAIGGAVPIASQLAGAQYGFILAKKSGTDIVLDSRPLANAQVLIIEDVVSTGITAHRVAEAIRAAQSDAYIEGIVALVRRAAPTATSYVIRACYTEPGGA